MENNFELFVTAYQNTNPKIKAVLDSEKIGIFAEQLLAEKQISDDFKPHVIRLVSNRLLNISDTQKDSLWLQNNLILKTEIANFVQTTIDGVVANTVAVGGDKTQTNAEVPTYTSTQEAILREARKLPDDTPEESVRWGEVG